MIWVFKKKIKEKETYIKLKLEISKAVGENVPENIGENVTVEDEEEEDGTNEEF